MAQPTTPKIEELRFRLKTDPKNRMFYVLAEELRRIGQFAEAEQVLRTGLEHHTTYLSAWVSLGRVLREQQKHAPAIEALSKALQLDPGNVVAARLLADTYLDSGEKLEALKKYKLVQALMPGDEQLEENVQRLELEVNRPTVPVSLAEPEPEEQSEPAAPPPEEPHEMVAAPAQEPLPEAPQAPAGAHEPDAVAAAAEGAPFVSRWDEPAPPEHAGSSIAESVETGAPFVSAWDSAGDAQPEAAPDIAESPEPSSAPAAGPSAEESEPVAPPAAPPASEPAWVSEALFTTAVETVLKDERNGLATGDAEPMSAAHAVSPFEEPLDSYTTGAVEIEIPAGIHIVRAPDSAEAPVVAETAALPPPELPLMTPELPLEEAGPAAVAETFAAGGVAAPEAEESQAESADVFAPAESTPEDVTNTLTMADLYARQGLVADARQIYDAILLRDPSNEAVRAKLAALEPAATHGAPEPDAGAEPPLEATTPPSGVDAAPSGSSRAKIDRLESWLAKVGRREAGGV